MKNTDYIGTQTKKEFSTDNIGRTNLNIYKYFIYVTDTGAIKDIEIDETELKSQIKGIFYIIIMTIIIIHPFSTTT